MQNEALKADFVLLTIPAAAIREAGIEDGAMLQITAEKGKIKIETVTDKSDFVCDGDCDNCPVNETDCDGDCEKCPCNQECEEVSER